MSEQQEWADLTTEAIESLMSIANDQGELLESIADTENRIAGALAALVRAVIASDTLDAEAKQTLALELKWLSGETS